MNYRFFQLVFIAILFAGVYSFADSNDSTALVKYDSLEINNLDSTKKVHDLIAIIGLGMTTGSIWDSWERDFSNGPALALGLEVPFSKSHCFAFQLYGHTWVAKSREWYDYDHYKRYIDLSSNFYSQIGLSAAIKFYLGNESEKFRASILLGYMFLCSYKEDTAIDIGFDLYYRINKNITINLSRRINLGHPDIGGSHHDVPNLLMLQICYNFQLVPL
jgi:hypothetical protein